MTFNSRKSSPRKSPPRMSIAPSFGRSWLKPRTVVFMQERVERGIKKLGLTHDNELLLDLWRRSRPLLLGRAPKLTTRPRNFSYRPGKRWRICATTASRVPALIGLDAFAQ